MWTVKNTHKKEAKVATVSIGSVSNLKKSIQQQKENAAVAVDVQVN